MNVRNLAIGVAALLTAFPAGAEGPIEHYAKVGEWQIDLEPDRKLCKMYRLYGSTENSHHIEGLFIRYDMPNERVYMRWSTNEAMDLPSSGSLELEMNFAKGESLDLSWGSRAFRYGKSSGMYFFDHSFSGAKDSKRILEALSKNGLIGLFIGPTMMTGLELGAADATRILRECSAKAEGAATVG